MIVECLVLYLLGDFGRVPLHAGAVVHRGRCAVLAGPGGAGKSTLVYACARAGLGVVAEDSIHVEPGGDDVRVRGNPFHLHLLPDAPRFFPELRGMSLTKRSSGKTKMRIDLGARFPGRCVPSARVAGVLTVGRAPSTGSRIVTEDRASVVDALMPRLVHQASGDASAARHAAERVAGASFARLEVGADPSGAVALIQQWLEDRPQGSCRQTSGARK